MFLRIADDPGIRLRELGDRVGITERAAYNIVTELAVGGYIIREPNGRRNNYTIHHHLPLPDRLADKPRIGDVIRIMGGLCVLLTGRGWVRVTLDHFVARWPARRGR